MAWQTHNAPLRCLRTAYRNAGDDVPALTKETLLEELTKPKYRVIKQQCGPFLVDGAEATGLTGLLIYDSAWPRRGRLWKKDAARSIAHQCHAGVMTAIRAKTLEEGPLGVAATVEVVGRTLAILAPITPEKGCTFGAIWVKDSPKLTATSFHKTWAAQKMYAHMGSEVDADAKHAILTEPKNVKYFTTSGALHALAANGLEPVAVNINVTSKKDAGRPDPFPVCDGCKTCLAEEYPNHVATEIDVVCFNSKTGKVCLVELKCTRHRNPTSEAMTRSQMQAWLTWIMFSNTYPQLRRHTEAVILTSSFQLSGEVTLTAVVPKTHNHTTSMQYSFIKQWCALGLSNLCPVPAPNVNPWTLSSKQKSYRGKGQTLYAKRFKAEKPCAAQEIFSAFKEIVDEAD